MTMNELMVLNAILAVVLIIAHGRAAYWKARAETLAEDRHGWNGWENEAKFWRRHFNSEAAEWTEDNV